MVGLEPVKCPVRAPARLCPGQVLAIEGAASVELLSTPTGAEQHVVGTGRL